MPNPYASPQATPTPDDPKALGTDSTLVRLRFRRRVCEVLIGALLIAIGLATVFGTFISPGSPPLTYGAVGAWVIAVGIVALLGFECPAFIVLAIAGMWLAFLTLGELHVESIEEPQRTQARIFRLFLATLGVALIPLAALGISTDRAIRRRRAELDRQDTSVAADRLEA